MRLRAFCLVLAAAAAPARAQPAAPRPPAPVAFLIAEPGRATDRRALHGLLFRVWGPRGTVRPSLHPGTPSSWSACVGGRKQLRLEVPCIQRLLPPAQEAGRPLVALFALPAGGRPFHTVVHCIGARGAGSAPFLGTLTGADGGGTGGRARNNMRSAIARCINEAAPGSVTGSVW